jgi:Putative nucleotidyltransferase DUF294/Putative nucleotidyltransferase substrate binding domain
MPAHLRCKRCARGLCEGSNNNFDANCFGPEALPVQKVCQVCKRIGQMRARRGSVSNLLTMGTRTGLGLQQSWSQRVDVIVRDLFESSLQDDPPCAYAVCMAGSGAREEASPYSDLDFFILVEDDSAPKVKFFKDACQRMKTEMLSFEGNWGLRFCNIMSPLGDPGNTKAPVLIRSPANMAALVEWGPDMIEGHVSGGLQEHRFLFGERRLYDAFKVDLNTIVGKTCFTMSSRPVITRAKKMGLKVIKDTVQDPRFRPPSKTDKYFHVKEQFYRPPQFLAKGLAWYYGIDEVGTAAQLRGLVQANRMTQTVANNFMAVLNPMAQLRFKLHLDREGEKDFVYLDQNQRDQELRRLKNLGQGASAEEKELRGRLDAGTFLTKAELKPLIDSISSLNYIMGLGRKFVAQKEKTFGKRGNPFAG